MKQTKPTKRENKIEIIELLQKIGEDEEGTAVKLNGTRLRTIALIANGRFIKLEEGFYAQITTMNKEEFDHRFPITINQPK